MDLFWRKTNLPLTSCWNPTCQAMIASARCSSSNTLALQSNNMRSRRWRALAVVAVPVVALLLLTATEGAAAWTLSSSTTTTTTTTTTPAVSKMIITRSSAATTGSSRVQQQQYGTRTTWHGNSLQGGWCLSSPSSTSHRMMLVSATNPATRRSSSALASSSNSDYNDHDHSDGDDMVGRNAARCNIQVFLTQRALQSFLYLCDTVRDPHSVKYLEDFLGVRNLLNYHGCGLKYPLLDDDENTQKYGTAADWDAPLAALTQQPPTVMIVSAKRRGRGHGGWSKDNPYLEERWVDFEIDIHPCRLASRILQVREQIAAEWVTDLAVLQTANEQILESYLERTRQWRDADPAREGVPPAGAAFDRTAVQLLNNHTDFAVSMDDAPSSSTSSPFRRGSFDLLYNLCTQAAVHRLLQQLRDEHRSRSAQQPHDDASYAWLRDFYAEHAAEYFDGDVPYGRADDFMEQLLLAPPALVPTQQSQQQSGQQQSAPMALADPMGIAEQIILLRSDIFSDWRERMLDVPAAHSGIRKVLLEKQVESWGAATPLGGGAGGGGESGSGDTGGSGGGSFE